MDVRCEAEALAEQDYAAIARRSHDVDQFLSGLGKARLLLIGRSNRIRSRLVRASGGVVVPSISLANIRTAVPALRDCRFYHSMDLPGFGTVNGDWDLRGRFDEYVGGVNLAGKTLCT